MKVDKEKFISAINYLKEINGKDLSYLDLSEFFDKDKQLFTRVESYTNSFGDYVEETICDTLEDAIEHWRFTGLDNKDFIMNYME